jgi:branched-chain amino acid transport system ATP-binding protein
MAEILLEARSLRKSFGALVATDGVDFDVREGETHAVIGPNGAGKTTFIKQLSGELHPDEGSIRFAGEEITGLPSQRRTRKGLSRSFQITSVYRDFSALDNVALAVQAHAGHSFRFWNAARQDRSLTGPALEILKSVGLGGRKDVLAAELAHGEQRQLEIAMALATQPRLMLLDEPVAGMGTDESARMVELLATLKGRDAGAKTIVLVEHDMDAVFSLADRISVLVYGRIIATGTPAEIRANAEVRAAYLGEEG